MGERLIHRYFEAVHPIARCVHRPSFEATYQSFWDDVSGDMEPRAPTQAVVFAAWLSAAVSLDEIRAQREYGCSKNQLVFNMRIGTETALSKAKFLSTTSVDTLQAFVMYMVSMIWVRENRSRLPRLTESFAASTLPRRGVQGALCSRWRRHPNG